ncbi:unnamed protein product, partial [Iphiclides podalirius]
MAGGRRPSGGGEGAQGMDGGGGQGGGGQGSAYRFAPARHTRPAMRAGAEKCEGALIGRGGPAPRPPAASAKASARAQFKGGCDAARPVVWVSRSIFEPNEPTIITIDGR